jgi:uncharacterized protein YndB with AHSA1/START domain
MQRSAAATPELTDAACRNATGKTLSEWFAVLDAAGGLDVGRRDLVHHVFDDAGKDEWWAVTIVVEYERARGAVEKDGRPKGYSICSTKTVQAPIAAVFAAFGDERLLSRWFGPGSRGTFAAGGVLTNGDGDRLTWDRIRADKDLRASWQAPDLAPGSSLEVAFADKGKGRTGITLNHTRIQERAAADRLRAGWSLCLDALKRLLEPPA